MGRVGWLSRQPELFRAAVLERCRLRQFARGTTLFSDAENSYAVYGLVNGDVELSFANGHVGTIWTPGYWIGKAEPFLGGPWQASVIAKTPVQMLCLPLNDYEQLMLNSDYSRSFAQLTAEHLDELFGIVAALMEHDPLVRVRNRLISLNRAQANAEEPLGLTHSELTSMCGLTRQTVAKVLKSLVREGAVALKYGKLSILDPAKLKGDEPNLGHSAPSSLQVENGCFDKLELP